MANPERGEARLEVDGTGYVLKLTMQSAIELQHRKKKPLGALFNSVTELDVDAIAGLLWACLQMHHPRQFRDEAAVVALMDRAGGFQALNLFVDAITNVVNVNKPSGNGASGEDPLLAQTGGTVDNSTSTPEASA